MTVTSLRPVRLSPGMGPAWHGRPPNHEGDLGHEALSFVAALHTTMPHTTEDNHAVLARIDERVIGIAEDLVALRQSMHDVKDNQNTHGLKIIISERDIIETKARLEDQARKLIEAIRNVDILMMSHHRGESRIKAIGGSALQVIVGLAVIFIAVKFGWQKP